MKAMWPNDRDPGIAAIKRFIFWGNVLVGLVILAILGLQGEFA